MKLLVEYNRHFRMAVSLVDAAKNQALVSAANYPALPRERSVELNPDNEDRSKPRFQPLQKGIKL
jgi:hypothetical protein